MAGIPLHITPLSYIRGSGSQYITTAINLRSTDVVRSKWRFENSAGNVYGCFTSSNGTDNFCLYAGSSSTDAYIRYNGQLVRDFRPANGSIHELEQGPGGFFDNGTKLTDFTPATFTCSAPMYLFMLPNSSSAKITARCYGLTVYRDGEQVCNFIPARNELTGEVGFYESVQGVFYENAGTGAFTAGPEVNFSVKTLLLKRRRALMGISKKPSDFVFVNYVENLLGTYSTTGIKPGGGGSYINTGIYPEVNDEIEIQFTPATDFYNQYISPFAVYLADQKNFGLILQRSHTYYYMGGQKDYTSLIWEASTQYKVVLNKTQLIRNDIEIINYDGDLSSFTSAATYPLYLFCNAASDPYYDGLYVFKGRISYMKYKRAGVLIHDFRPCYRRSNPQDAGFYDVISGQFFGDASGQMGLTFG